MGLVGIPVQRNIFSQHFSYKYLSF
jgi:hypothetical protein